jgi:hypothetical protein
MKARPAILGPLAAVMITAGCAAAASTASGPAGQGGSRLSLVAFSLRGIQAWPATLTATSDFSVTTTIRSGYACLSMGAELLEWPAGYTATESGSGQVQVFDPQGRVVLRTGQPAQLDEAEIGSGANPCDGRPSTVIAIAEVIPPIEWAPVGDTPP